MRVLSRVSLLQAGVLLVGALACAPDALEPPAGDPPSQKRAPVVPTGSPIESPDGPVVALEPRILALGPDAPSLAATSVTVWVHQGRPGRVELPFVGLGRDLARLDFGPRSLAARPDGSPILLGDSVAITITASALPQVVVELEPHGLVLDLTDPVRLTLDYRDVSPDYNGDGTVDAADEAIEDQLSIWHQAGDGGPYTADPSERQKPIKKVRADITGFSRYALAY